MTCKRCNSGNVWLITNTVLGGSACECRDCGCEWRNINLYKNLEPVSITKTSSIKQKKSGTI